MEKSIREITMKIKKIIRTDNKGFLFSYNKNEIYYRNKDEQIELCTGYNHGPLFGK